MFTCNATAFPVPSFEWKKDNNAIVNRAEISYTNSRKTLAISGITENDAGNYTCIISHSGGSTISPIAVLSVQCMYASYLILSFDLV